MAGSTNRPSGPKTRRAAEDQRAAKIKRAFRSDNAYSMMKKGGKATHKTKDGRTVKKGLYYYMNKRKKAGTSRPGTGTVSAKALKRSAKTAKKK